MKNQLLSLLGLTALVGMITNVPIIRKFRKDISHKSQQNLMADYLYTQKVKAAQAYPTQCQAKGLKKFTINGIEIYALNAANAEKKANKLLQTA